MEDFHTQRLFVPKKLTARLAIEGFFLCMGSFVVVQVLLITVFFTTKLAGSYVDFD